MSKRILFVCMGNICRSPTAEGVFRAHLERLDLALDVELDSAGTHGFHVGHPPDSRAAEAAARRGISLSGITARQIEAADFERFDLILCADTANRDRVEAMRPKTSKAEIRMILDFAMDADEIAVPDPYYGGDKGFERVLDLIESACEGLIRYLR